MLLIIDNRDSFTYNLYQAVAVWHADVCVFRSDQLSLGAIKALDLEGIILSPGPGHPREAKLCIELIQAIVSGSFLPIPLLGVCLGHQAIVEALGGAVIQADEIMHGKEDLIFHDGSGLYTALSQPLKVGRYHSLIAERESLPRSLIIDAENNKKYIMGIHHVAYPIYGVQFHPESILTPEGPQLLKSFIDFCSNKGLYF